MLTDSERTSFPPENQDTHIFSLNVGINQLKEFLMKFLSFASQIKFSFYCRVLCIHAKTVKSMFSDVEYANAFRKAAKAFK